MRKLVGYRELESRVSTFLQALEEFKTLTRRKLPEGGLYACDWLEKNIPSKPHEIFDLVRLQASDKDWVPRAKDLLLVTPNTGFTTGIVALFWAYMSGVESIGVRPGGSDQWTPIFTSLLRQRDERVSLHSFGRLKMSELERELSPYDMIVVYGSQDTVNKYKLSALNADVVSYGPKMSIAVHERNWWDLENSVEGSLVQDMTERYYRDITTYDGLGCLNTSVLYTLHWNDNIKKGVESLASKLEEFSASRNPVMVQNWQFEASRREDFVEMWGPVVRRTVREVDDFLPIGYGTLYVVKIDSEEDLVSEWKNKQCLLSSSTLWSGVDNRNHWISVLSECGSSRVTWTGEAQNPSLTWENGGANPLRSLVKVISGDEEF